MRKFHMLILGAVLVASPVRAEKLRVTVENLQSADGFYVTPVWAGFHDGGFDIFNSGDFASATLKALAEGGAVEGLQGDFASHGSGIDGILAGPAGFGSSPPQPPVLDPGEVSSIVLDVDRANRYLSFATMVIPSNDGFFANDDPMGIEVFDSSGQFSFAGPLTLGLANLWDSGTEVNNGMGAAFSANGGEDTTEGNPIALHSGLINFDGTGTAAGTTIDFANASSFSVLRLTVSQVPEPNSLAFAAMLAVGTLGRRRTRSNPSLS